MLKYEFYLNNFQFHVLNLQGGEIHVFNSNLFAIYCPNK
jgi:hypothetical protein